MAKTKHASIRLTDEQYQCLEVVAQTKDLDKSELLYLYSLGEIERMGRQIIQTRRGDPILGRDAK